MRTRNHDPKAEKILINDQNQLNREIEIIEAKIKNLDLKFDKPTPSKVSDELNENPKSLGYQIENMIDKETYEKTSFSKPELDNFLRIAKTKYTEIQAKKNIHDNQVVLAENEVMNKILHKMDIQDIKCSIYKRIIAIHKQEILQDAVENYRSVVTSLEDLNNIIASESDRHGYISTKRIINSKFYEQKISAKICYQSFFQKLMDLQKKM